jgi:hypothetical protein
MESCPQSKVIGDPSRASAIWLRKSAGEINGDRMIDEARESFDSVLFVGLARDDEVKLTTENPASVCISYDCAASDVRDPLRCDLGFRNLAEFQRASKRVDLVIFGSNTSASSIGSVIARFAHDDAVIVTEPLTLIARKEMSAVGCGNGQMLTLRRVGGVQVVVYEMGGDYGARMAAKLLAEFE